MKTTLTAPFNIQSNPSQVRVVICSYARNSISIIKHNQLFFTVSMSWFIYLLELYTPQKTVFRVEKHS